MNWGSGLHNFVIERRQPFGEGGVFRGLALDAGGGVAEGCGIAAEARGAGPQAGRAALPGQVGDHAARLGAPSTRSVVSQAGDARPR